jgi:cytochrome c556
VLPATWLRVAGLAGLLIGAGLTAPAWTETPKEKGAVAVTQDKDKDKARTVEDVMEEIHGDDGLRTKIARAIRAKKLEDAKKPAEQWVELAGQLGKMKPPRGGAESWKKLSANYEKQVQTVAAAVKSEKPEAAREALRAIGGSCNACHVAHKKP